MDKEVLEIAWDLRKRQIKAWWNYWTRWTLIPTAKIAYALQEQYRKGLGDSGISVKTLEILNNRLERLERDNEIVNTINKNLLEKVRKYVQFFRNNGISEEVLEMDIRGRSSRYTLSKINFTPKKNKKARSSRRSSRKERKDTKKTH